MDSPRGASRTAGTARAESTEPGRAALVAALRAFTAESSGSRPWMPATSLAQVVGVDSPGDPQFVADVQALSDDGTIRLMSFGGAGAADFFAAMLAPPAPPAETPVD